MSSIPAQSGVGEVLARFVERRRAKLASPWWVVALLVIQISCQLGTLFLGDTPLRIVFRIGVFAASLLLVVIVTPRVDGHPSMRWSWLILIILGLGLAHPLTNTLKSGLAQIAMYAAILAPLFFVAGIYVDFRWFRRFVIIIWAFAFAGALLGALQTQFPWLQPDPSIVLQERLGGALLPGLMITLADGSQVFRPMGLSDTPGGAANAGMIAIILGCGILATERSWWLKGAAALGTGVSVYCILLSQVRSILIMTAIGVLIVAVMMIPARAAAVAAKLLLGISLAVGLGASVAIVIGGEQTLARLETLVSEDASTVYYNNRGHFLHRTLVLDVPQYPVGAGLGRWGMMNSYFGVPRETLWVEIMWTGWVYDGGIPLVLAYVGAILASFYACWRIIRSTVDRRLAMWAAVVFGYGMAMLAVTFNAPIFLSEIGLTFWLLNATLYAAWQTAVHQRRVTLVSHWAAARGDTT